jgi:hypothetical protein
VRLFPVDDEDGNMSELFVSDLQITDPDGNEFLFPLDDTNDRERQK